MGHSYLKMFCWICNHSVWCIILGHSDGFLRWQFTLRHAHSLREIRHLLHIGVWDNWVISFDMTMLRHTLSLMLIDSWWFTLGHTPLSQQWILEHNHPLELIRFFFNIGVWDMVGWFDWMCLKWWHNPLIGIDLIWFLRWLDHSVDTCENYIGSWAF